MTAPIERAAEALMEAYNLCGDDRGCFCDDARETGRQMARIVLNSIDGKREGPVMSEPMKFRKKPVVIEAMLYTGDNWVEIAQWLRAHDVKIGKTSDGKASIPTLEGVITASAGDWIIRGVQGEFYPCKPDVFEVTYEEEGQS